MKIWFILSVIVILTHGAPTSPSHQKEDEIVDSIESIQNKFKMKKSDGQSSSEEIADEEDPEFEEDYPRTPRMFNFYGYYPPQFVISTAISYPNIYPTINNIYPMNFGILAPVYDYNNYNNYYEGNEDDYEDGETQEENNDVENNNEQYFEELYSRANTRRRRPGAGGGGSSKNSPIFYIKLPPTPYMFVPGMGYISNPPTITPMPAPIPSPSLNPYYSNPQGSYPGSNPYLQQPNPFFNLPLNFMTNGRPTNVYQFPNKKRPNHHSSSSSNRFPQNPYSPQQPVRQKPYRPNKRPSNNYSDSKITNLKGQYLFNGRPNQIYLLQNPQYSFPYSNPLQSFY